MLPELSLGSFRMFSFYGILIIINHYREFFSLIALWASKRLGVCQTCWALIGPLVSSTKAKNWSMETALISKLKVTNLQGFGERTIHMYFGQGNLCSCFHKITTVKKNSSAEVDMKQIFYIRTCLKVTYVQAMTLKSIILCDYVSSAFQTKDSYRS